MKEWEKIKNHWRNEFHQTEIYTDENEHIIIFNQSDSSVVIIGYLYFLSSFSVAAYNFVDFIKFMRKLGDINFNSYKILLLSNYRLSKISKSRNILTLPNDIEYYYVDYNSFYDSIDFKLESLSKAAENSSRWEQVVIPWHKRTGIPVITDNRFQDWAIWANKGYQREWYMLAVSKKQLEGELHLKIDQPDPDVMRAGVVFQRFRLVQPPPIRLCRMTVLK